MEALLHETINHGSLASLWETHGSPSPADVLVYIASQKNINDSALFRAYRIVCNKLSPREQYLPDGIHFLARVQQIPEYGAICLCFESQPEIIPELPIDKNNRDSEKVATVLSRALVKLHVDASFRFQSMLMAGQKPPRYACLQTSDIKLAIEFGSPHIKLFLTDTGSLLETDLSNALLNNDAFSYLEYYRDSFSLNQIIGRCSYLKTKAPRYWSHIDKKYGKLLEYRISKENNRSMARATLQEVHDLFPSLIDERLLSFSDLALKIYSLEPYQRAYYLGFPIHLGLPIESDVMEALGRLSVQGPEKYLSDISLYNQKSLQISLPFREGPLIPELDCDFMTESIYGYNLFDVVPYVDNGHYYIFTRVEFSSMLKNKRHIYTRNLLPDHFLSEITLREIMAKNLGLPDPVTLEQLYDRLLKRRVPETIPPVKMPSLRSESIEPSPELLSIITSLYVDVT